MTKRLFSLTILLGLAIGVWPDNMATFSSQTVWTADEYTGSDFGKDTDHAASLSGTFSGTSVNWSATAVLTCGADASIVFGHTRSGKLYVVYGATTSTDGTFSIKHQGSGDSETASLYEETMTGIDYTGPLGAPKSTRSLSDNKFTRVEAVVSLSGEGTVYLSGSQPYCIYAILYVPEPLSMYGIYDLRSIASEQVSGESGVNAVNLIERSETASGDNTNISGKLTENGAISVVYRQTTDGSKDFKWNKSTDAAQTGLQMPRGGAGELSFYINNLKAGDWFRIYTGDNHLLFNNTDFYDLNEGSSNSVSKGGVVESGHTYVAKKDVSALQLYYDTKQQGYLYIYKVEISNGDAVPAPVISDYDFSSGKVTITVENSYKGNTPTIYYGIGDAEPTTAYTGPISISEACTIKALAKVDDLQSTLAVKDVVLEAVTIPEISVSGKQVTITGGTSNDPSSSVTTYYTLNGAEPTTSSTKYASAITLDQTRIVKVMSVSSSGIKSDVITQKVVIDGQTPSTVLDFTSDEALKPLEWGQDHVTGYYNNGSDKSDGNFKYITNEPVHAKMMWQSDKNDTENANNNAGNGIEGISNGRAFAINDLAVGDVIYITYTTTGDKLTTSKHSTKGNTVKIGETIADGGNALTTVEAGVKIEVTAIDADNNYVMFMPNNKMNITRIAINPEYTITATAEHGTVSVTSPSGTNLESAFEHGATVTLTATPESSEWVFSHWVVNGIQTTEATLTLTMDSNKTVEAVFRQRVSANGVPVILVAGQSNTDGRIAVSETAFPYDLNHTQISYCNGVDQTSEGVFAPYGTTPKSDSGERWGYDAVVYDKIQTALGDEDFYVIKQSKGNTAINTMCSGNGQNWWSANPVWLDRNTSANQGGRSLLKAFLDNIDKSLKALEDANKEYDIKFLMWHQGEADRGKASEYEVQMKAVVNEVRNYLVTRTGNNKYSNLPIILGGIADVSNEYNVSVEEGKQSLAAADANIYYAPTGVLTLDTDFRSDKVHFNATGASKIADSVWDIITTNNLMTGITLAGNDSPAENPLVEDVIGTTKTWTFTTKGALAVNQSIDGMYPHGGNVKERNYGTIMLIDNSTIDGAYAAETNAADRKNAITQGLTAGNNAVTHIYSVNVDVEGLFMAVIRPQNTKNSGFARLMFNGEELQAIQVTSTTENIQLAGKSTGKGTFAVTCGDTWDMVGMKFVAGASDLEIMTPPTIQAGEKVNTIKIIPGTSDVADVEVKTYYTTDDTSPTAESTLYTGGDIKLTEDCVVRAVSISSNGGKAYSAVYFFEKAIEGQTIQPSTKFQTFLAEKALDFTGLANVEAYIVTTPNDVHVDVGSEPKDGGAALAPPVKRAQEAAAESPSALQLVRVYKVPGGTAVLVKYPDMTAGAITAPYMVEAITSISTATGTIQSGDNLLKRASQAVTAGSKKIFQANGSGERFGFDETESVSAGIYYLEVSATVIGENTVSIEINESTDIPYLVETESRKKSETSVFDFASACASGDVELTTAKAGKLNYLNKNGAASGPSDFSFIANAEFGINKLSLRGASDWTLSQLDGGLKTLKDDRQLAIHQLKKGDVIGIVYEGGTLKYATVADKGDAATVLGSALSGLAPIASKAKVVVSKIVEDNNYMVFYPSAKCVIKQIFINPTDDMLPDDSGTETDPDSTDITVTNAVVTLTDDSRKDRKIYQAVFGEKQKFYYMRPGQDETARSQGYKDSYKETPFTVTVSNNGDFIYWTTETIDGKQYESEHNTIVVNTIAKKPTVTYQSVKDTVSVYRIVFSKGTTLHYTLGDGEEQTYSEKDTLDLSVKATGMMKVYSKNDYVVSDTTSVRAYAPTPSVLYDGVYDFSKLREVIGADYTLTTWGYDGTLVVGGVTLNKPSAMTAKTFEGLALAAPVKTDGESTESNDWRLLNAGRLRAYKSGNDKYLAIMGVKQGDYLLLNYSGASMKYLPTGTARLSEGIDTLKTQKAYRIETGGDLLLSIPADTIQNCDITSITMTSKETVESPTIALKNDSIPNVVRIRVGKSSLGLPVSIRYTTDGSDPKLDNSTESVKSPVDLTFDESAVIKAVTLSESGVMSAMSMYELKLPVSPNASSVVYEIDKMLVDGRVVCDTLPVGVYNKEYNSAEATWSTKQRTDFRTLANTNGMLSVRSGESSFQLQSDSVRVRLTRALAVHQLGMGDEIVFVYTGDGSLWSAAADEGDEFTVNGRLATAGTRIPSGAVIKVTKTKYSNNYVVVTPVGEKSGRVYIQGIYINAQAPAVATVPTVELSQVVDGTAVYRFSYEEGEQLHYILETDGKEQTGLTSGICDVEITNSTKVKAWTTRGANGDQAVSDTLSTTLFAPTPAPSEYGDVDFAEVSDGLPSDLEVTLDLNQDETVDGEQLYKPSALTAATFADRFAFSETNTSGKIKIRTGSKLMFAKGSDMSMAILNLRAGDIVAFDYTGSIQIANADMLEQEQMVAASSRRAEDVKTYIMESGTAYEVRKDGDLLLKLLLEESDVNITKMYVADKPHSSEATSILFATAVEEYEALEYGKVTNVYYDGKESAQKFYRLNNDLKELPIRGKLSVEGGLGELVVNGFMASNRRVAIHNVARGDVIVMHIAEGGVTYEGHATKGDRIRVGDHVLEPGDSLKSGDVIVVEKVDYLNNYVVLKLDSKTVVTAMFINSEEVENISMPTIVDKGKNVIQITAGKSSIGMNVTTCYTVDGTEPTEQNGTSGPYGQFEVKLLESGMVTIKAITYSETGRSSSTALLVVYADKMVYGPSFLMDENGNMYDVYNVYGQKVNAVQRGQLYIVNGKKVIYK